MSAPPPPRRPARRPAPEIGQITVVIEGAGLPGLSWPGADEMHPNVHIGLAVKGKEAAGLVVPGNPWLASGPVPGDAPSARWQAVVTVRRDADGLDFAGPNVRGDRTDRNLFLPWGEVRDDGTMRLIRGSKLKLGRVEPRLIEEAMRPGHRLVVRLRFTGSDEERIPRWSAEPAGAEPG
jgi:Family of unknown function (DUF5990)